MKMPDYRSVLLKAILNLATNNVGARQELYRRARTAIGTQLANEPSLPAAETALYRDALENAIIEVEIEASASDLPRHLGLAPPSPQPRD
jgi:hypothetical protein